MSNNAPQGFLVALGDAYIGETLTARANGISDGDGIRDSTQSFQWLRDGDPISGATQQTYVVTSADVGSQISLKYVYTDGSGNEEIITSKPEPAVPAVRPEETDFGVGSKFSDPDTENPNNIAPMGFLAVLGDALEGETLTARPNGITDADGIDSSTAKFQWLRDGEPIQGATSNTYVVGAADRGANISLQWSFIDKLGTKETIISPEKPAVPGGTTPPKVEVPVEDPVKEPADEPALEAPEVPETPVGHVNSGPVGNVFILGLPIENTNLLARLDALYDRDSIIESSGRFQWLRDGEPIEGATEKVYTVTADDRGATLSAQYSYMDGHGTLETVVSDPEAPVPFPEGQGTNNRQDDDTSDDEVSDGDSEEDDVELAVTTPEDDVVTITSAMSRVDGLGGYDTAILTGDQTDYTITFSPDGVAVTDRTADGLGIVELENFEFLDFGTEIPAFDGPMDLSQFGGHTGLDQESFESLVEMYIAYFNSAPDAVGLAFWGTAYANGMSLQEIANEFAGQPETSEIYPVDASNVKFVADVYQNVLGRAADIDGLRFWSNALNEGDTERGEFILAMLNGVEDGSDDREYLDQKTDLGALFAVHRGMSNANDAAQVMALYDGSDASVQNAVDAIDALYTAAIDSENGDFLMPLVGVMDDTILV